MLLADHLSRAAQYEVSKPEDTFQVFSLELENIVPVQTLKIAPERLSQLQQSTGQDTALQTLKSTVLTGWPERREEVPVNIREYWNYRDELSVNNGVLFKGQKVIIPKAMRAETMSRIHSSHLGIEACLRKARDSVFWPNMSSEVKEKIKQCEICSEFQSKNQKQPMQSQQIPERPWSRVATDQFELYKKDYIVLVDYFSDFVEVEELNVNTTSSVVKFLKKQFSRHGIPDTVVSDNAPQYTSYEFKQFSREWEFVHVTSSPHHHKANGKAESAVKIVKSLFKKALRDNKDPWLALLDYRNTPTEGIGESPAQRLMSRRTRTLLPVATSLLYPTLSKNVQDKLKIRRQKAKLYYDRSARVLPEIQVGQDVRIAPLQRNQSWKQGSCLKELSDRSYLVQTGNQVIRRNREFLKPAETKPVQQPLDGLEETGTENKKVQPVENCSLPKVVDPLVKRTRTRVVQTPAKFKDFVLSS